MRVYRCPRCRAEDIAADAHPARVFVEGIERPFFVCRNCYRPAELEFRIACQASGATYLPLTIRGTLALLRGFYRARLDERAADDESEPGANAHIEAALAEVERRLSIGPLPDQ